MAKKADVEELEELIERCAGIDVGQAELVVCARVPDRSGKRCRLIEAGVIRHAKFDRTPSGAVARHDRGGPAHLRDPTRDRFCPAPSSAAFFVSSAGTPLNRSDVAKTLRRITTAMGLRSTAVRPTAHQLRHSLAVRTLIGWHRSGVTIDERIAALSIFLGHVSPADTYWYLSRRLPNSWPWPPNGSTRGSGRRHERVGSNAAGLLHRPVDQPTGCEPGGTVTHGHAGRS